MALKLNITAKKLPLPVKIFLAIIPAVIIVVAVLVLLILPKNKEIKELDAKIAKQDNEIAADQAKVAKLPELTLEYERLKKRLEELKSLLPEENEVSTLLKQVSDLCITSGLKVQLWKPEQKKTHTSGIVYEIPVKVELSGGFHNLGYFLGSLTKLNRIVNISNISLADPKPDKGVAVMKVAFTGTTFSSVPEEEIQKAKKGAGDKQAGKGRKK